MSDNEIIFHTLYDTPKDVSITFEQPSLTEQSYKDECSIDFIIDNFVKTGIDPTDGRSMNYVDCTSVQDFQSAQNLVADTKSIFYALPSAVRDEFKTVDNYLSYVSNPANLRDSYERNLIDRSTVDLKDVYPEQYVNTSVSSVSTLESSPSVPSSETPVTQPSSS